MSCAELRLDSAEFHLGAEQFVHQSVQIVV